MKNYIKYFCCLIALVLCSKITISQETETPQSTTGFFAKPFGGFSLLSSVDATILEGSTAANLKINPKIGFATGATIGYEFSNSFRVQANWEYKTNTIDAQIENTTYTGDYASNTISVEGVYLFTTQSKWQPYIGLGISTIEEIDIDLQIENNETSFATSGLFGYQGIIGANYFINEKLLLDFEFRNTRFSNYEMDAEDTTTTTQLTDLKYNPLTFHFGVTFRF